MKHCVILLWQTHKINLTQRTTMSMVGQTNCKVRSCLPCLLLCNKRVLTREATPQLWRGSRYCFQYKDEPFLDLSSFNKRICKKDLIQNIISTIRRVKTVFLTINGASVDLKIYKVMNTLI